MTRPVVVVDGLTRRFGVRRGVSNVSFEIMPGEVFGFLGPNGAGKSTTIRLLLGLYRPDAGRMQVFGTPSVTVPRSGVASANADFRGAVLTPIRPAAGYWRVSQSRWYARRLASMRLTCPRANRV